MCSRLSSNSLTFYCCMCALATVTYMSFSHNKCIKMFTRLNKKINVCKFITNRESTLSMTLKPTSSWATGMINGRQPKCNDKLRMGECILFPLPFQIITLIQGIGNISPLSLMSCKPLAQYILSAMAFKKGENSVMPTLL